MWLGIVLCHSWAASPEGVWVMRYAALPARGGGRSVPLPGTELTIDSRELITEVSDQSV